MKNTDSQFLETWHLRREGGIIDPYEVFKSVRDTLAVPEVLIFLEVPGKRGREIGEKRAVEEHLESIRLARDALGRLGYREDPEDFGWVHPG